MSVPGIPGTATVQDQKPEQATAGTQIANPNRTTVRTLAQSIVGFLALVNIVTPMVLDSLKTLPDGWLPGWVFAFVNGVAVVAALLAALVARVMASPAVNAAVVKYLPWLAPIKSS